LPIATYIHRIANGPIKFNFLSLNIQTVKTKSGTFTQPTHRSNPVHTVEIFLQSRMAEGRLTDANKSSPTNISCHQFKFVALINNETVKQIKFNFGQFKGYFI
jgi:hypothetical protein